MVTTQLDQTKQLPWLGTVKHATWFLVALLGFVGSLFFAGLTGQIGGSSPAQVRYAGLVTREAAILAVYSLVSLLALRLLRAAIEKGGVTTEPRQWVLRVAFKRPWVAHIPSAALNFTVTLYLVVALISPVGLAAIIATEFIALQPAITKEIACERETALRLSHEIYVPRDECSDFVSQRLRTAGSSPRT